MSATEESKLIVASVPGVVPKPTKAETMEALVKREYARRWKVYKDLETEAGKVRAELDGLILKTMHEMRAKRVKSKTLKEAVAFCAPWGNRKTASVTVSYGEEIEWTKEISDLDNRHQRLMCEGRRARDRANDKPVAVRAYLRDLLCGPKKVVENRLLSDPEVVAQMDKLLETLASAGRTKELKA